MQPNSRRRDFVMYYHAHVYWSTPEQRTTALSLRDLLAETSAGLGRVWDQPIGTHPLPRLELDLAWLEEYVRKQNA